MNPPLNIDRHAAFRASLAAQPPADPVDRAIDELDREKCRRLLIEHIGEGGFVEFLRTTQTSFGDRTGAELLTECPSALLERLEHLDRIRR